MKQATEFQGKKHVLKIYNSFHGAGYGNMGMLLISWENGTGIYGLMLSPVWSRVAAELMGQASIQICVFGYHVMAGLHKHERHMRQLQLLDTTYVELQT